MPGPTIHTVMVTSTTNFCPNTFSSFSTSRQGLTPVPEVAHLDCLLMVYEYRFGHGGESGEREQIHYS